MVKLSTLEKTLFEPPKRRVMFAAARIPITRKKAPEKKPEAREYIFNKKQLEKLFGMYAAKLSLLGTGGKLTLIREGRIIKGATASALRNYFTTGYRTELKDRNLVKLDNHMALLRKKENIGPFILEKYFGASELLILTDYIYSIGALHNAFSRGGEYETKVVDGVRKARGDEIIQKLKKTDSLEARQALEKLGYAGEDEPGILSEVYEKTFFDVGKIKEYFGLYLSEVRRLEQNGRIKLTEKDGKKGATAKALRDYFTTGNRTDQKREKLRKLHKLLMFTPEEPEKVATIQKTAVAFDTEKIYKPAELAELFSTPVDKIYPYTHSAGKTRRPGKIGTLGQDFVDVLRTSKKSEIARKMLENLGLYEPSEKPTGEEKLLDAIREGEEETATEIIVTEEPAEDETEVPEETPEQIEKLRDVSKKVLTNIFSSIDEKKEPEAEPEYAGKKTRKRIEMPSFRPEEREAAKKIPYNIFPIKKEKKEFPMPERFTGSHLLYKFVDRVDEICKTPVLEGTLKQFAIITGIPEEELKEAASSGLLETYKQKGKRTHLTTYGHLRDFFKTPEFLEFYKAWKEIDENVKREKPGMSKNAYRVLMEPTPKTLVQYTLP